MNTISDTFEDFDTDIFAEEFETPEEVQQPERVFPELDGLSLVRAARHYKTVMPTPKDITPEDIANTTKKTPQAALMKQVMSITLATLNRAMNELLFSLPETYDMTDEQVKMLPGFPTQGEINEAVLDFLMTRGLDADWFQEPTPDGMSDPEDWDAFQFMADGITSRAKRWSPTSAWSYRTSSRKGGMQGKKTAPRAISDLVAWRGPLPSVEWVAEKYGKKRAQAYLYLAEARRLRGEP